MNSPIAILKLWNKAVLQHEQGKKPAELSKKGQEQKLKIKKALTQLRFEAAADMKNPTHRTGFEKLQKQIVTTMSKYAVYLKKATDEDKKVFPKWFKMVKQLIVLVQNLDPGTLDLNDDTEPGLDSLGKVSTDALDARLDAGGGDLDGDNDDGPSPSAKALDDITSSEDQSTTWQVARSDAIKQIRALQTALAKTKDEEATEIVEHLQDIIDELPDNLDSKDGVTALEQYILKDEIVALAEQENPFDVKMDFRKGLVKALHYAKRDL